MATQKIVVVDDEQDNVDFLLAILSEASLDAIGFTDGTKALERMQQDPPSLAILDVQMPGTNGFQLLKAMRGVEDLKGVPVIFLSAIDAVTGIDYDPETIEARYGVRPDAFVAKPIDEDRVLSAIRKIQEGV